MTTLQDLLTDTHFRALWSDPDAILFQTVHGSRLYGLAHANSDHDTFTVTSPSKRRTRQSIVGKLDSTRMSFTTFARRASDGAPQMLEAMFSTMVTVDEFAPYRADFRATGTHVFDTYYRTIKNFAMSDAFKTRRHALRLCLNLVDLMEHERFNPTLTPAQAELVTSLTEEGERPSAQYLHAVNTLAPIEIFSEAGITERTQ